ncbi:MAG: hypothetical protein M1360_03095 [Candidatus Marsarchaeota archaeon]|jgi:hypothetical protein|nr:hypothetical protein [Candidatus Marsarchaeota archaeon]MCL5418900.1 hypothetical protein [Candidatus Marsarchaeota archaeon]
MAINPDDLLIFEVREEASKKAAKKAKPVAAPNVVAPAREEQPVYRSTKQAEVSEQMFVVPEPSESAVEASINIATDRALASEMVSKKGKGRETRSEEESREAALGLYCVWHPWRPAYAVCAYCHRPFCFEDIVESGGNYYCLEDIDKVATTPQQSVYVKYNNFGIVAAGALLAAFVVFVYYGSGQIASMVKLSNAIGILEFSTKLGGPYGFILLGTIMSILMLVAAVMILMQTKRSFMLGLVVSFINLAAFSYEYLSTTTAYEAIVSIASFVGLVMLLYSKSAYEGAAEEEQYEEPAEELGQKYPASMPNIGRF